MNAFYQTIAPQAPSGRGKVAKAGAAGRATRRESHDCHELVIAPDVFSELAIRGMIEDWIIPALVERLMQSVTQLPSPREEG